VGLDVIDPFQVMKGVVIYAQKHAEDLGVHALARVAIAVDEQLRVPSR
jgi:hypothetical protein